MQGRHLALAHLLQQVVESGKDGVVVYARSHLQCRLHLSLHTPLAVGAHEDTKVVDAVSLQEVKLATETCTVSALSL